MPEIRSSATNQIQSNSSSSRAYEIFLEKIDAINIDKNLQDLLGINPEDSKTELRNTFQAQVNHTNTLLCKASTETNSANIDRLAKLAFAFAPEENDLAQRAVRILGNKLQNAGPQNAFHIKARLEQVDYNSARDAINQASNIATIASPDEVERDNSRNIAQMLAKYRQEVNDGLIKEPSFRELERPSEQSASDTQALKIMDMIRAHRMGE
jgi:hypothetical protein